MCIEHLLQVVAPSATALAAVPVLLRGAIRDVPWRWRRRRSDPVLPEHAKHFRR